MSRRIYKGLPKPGHAVIEGRALGELPGTPVRSPFFARHLGFENVLVPPVGTVRTAADERPRARPVVVLTDLLQADPLRPGGLVDERPGDDGEEPWLECTRLLLGRLAERRVLTVLPADQHLNPEWVDRDAPTRIRLQRALLSPDELERVRRAGLESRLDDAAADPLTAGEYEAVFGPIADKEDRNFVPHCYEGVVEYIPSVRALLEAEADELARQVQAGCPMPMPWLLPDFKTGLSCVSAPDRRGLDGNALRDILVASQAGLYFDGPQRAHERLAIVGGTAHEYSVAELVRFLIDLDYTVVLLLSCTGGLGIESKIATTASLRERYGRKLFATWQWPCAELLGPAPRGFAESARSVRRRDEALHRAWFDEHVARLEQGAGALTSLGEPVVHDADALRSAGVVGGVPATAGATP